MHLPVRAVAGAFAVALVAGCASPGARLHALLDEAWEAQMRWSPTWATSLGGHRYDDRLADLSLAAQGRRVEELRGFQARLAGIPRETLSDEDRLNGLLFEHHVETQLTDLQSGQHLIPVNQLGGPHLGLPLILVSHPFRNAGDYANYLSRLRAFPGQVEQAIACMREGIRTGFVAPRLTVEPTLEQMQSLMAADPDTNELYKPLLDKPNTLKPAESVEIDALIRMAIAEEVVPAYQRLHDFVRDVYLPACRETVGIWDVPGGEAIYNRVVERYTTTALTPEEIHQIGLDELERIGAEMDDIRRQQGFDGTLPEYLKHLRGDPRYRAPSGAWLLQEYQAILERTEPRLGELFGHLPQAPCIVKELEPFRAASAPAAYYNAAALDGSRPGFFYVNTSELQERVIYTTEALTYHEAVPGHHLQFMLDAENESRPTFRRHVYISAYSEGWALYAEGLGAELGGYTDPLQRFGRLTYDAWRAGRLVVDTGLHRFRWTRAQAIAFMEEHTGLARFNIEREVDRYIAWPGQALAYKIGELRIRELRAAAEERLGDRFDVRAFHDRVLGDGGLPLDILTERVKDWICRQAPAQERQATTAR
ncbi:MAG TPA: DUF885 domain-containing protein [Phycisphaerae bacterium]|nr:DUF885 domain-containing protein [Phycisphaerae bacterium]